MDEEKDRRVQLVVGFATDFRTLGYPHKRSAYGLLSVGLDAKHLAQNSVRQSVSQPVSQVPTFASHVTGTAPRQHQQSLDIHRCGTEQSVWVFTDAELSNQLKTHRRLKINAF